MKTLLMVALFCTVASSALAAGDSTLGRKLKAQPRAVASEAVAKVPTVEKTKDALPAYEPMQIFAPLLGKTLRGEGSGPDGDPVVDHMKWELILGGRAVQSTHRVEDTSYGGRTIFFFDESSKKYVYHYFTTAGFHTIGEVTPIANGFTAIEKVIGHAQFDEVHAKMIFDGQLDGEVFLVTTNHIDKQGKASGSNGFVYREVTQDKNSTDGVLFFDEADAIFGKRTIVKDAHDGKLEKAQ